MSLLECEEAHVLLEDAVVVGSTAYGYRQRLPRIFGRYLPLFYRQEQPELARLVIQGRLSHLDGRACEPIALQAGVERKPAPILIPTPNHHTTSTQRGQSPRNWLA